MKWSMHKINVVDISDSFQNTHIYNVKVANKFLTVSYRLPAVSSYMLVYPLTGRLNHPKQSTISRKLIKVTKLTRHGKWHIHTLIISVNNFQ